MYRGQSWGHYKRRYKDDVYQEFEMVLDAHANLKGVAFCRDKVRDSFYEDNFIVDRLDPMPIHMIAVGEETGALDVMLNKVITDIIII